MLLAYRFLKVLAVAAAVGGTFGVMTASDQADARRIGLRVALPGLCAAWVLGFLLAYETSVSFLSTWVLCAMATSFFALHGILFAIGRAERRRAGSSVAVVLLVATVALMVWRPA